jgi:hypothetical protein
VQVRALQAEVSEAHKALKSLEADKQHSEAALQASQVACPRAPTALQLPPLTLTRPFLHHVAAARARDGATSARAADGGDGRVGGQREGHGAAAAVVPKRRRVAEA